MSHHWSGWPGATCLHCGAEDPMEYVMANNLFDPWTRRWVSPEAEQEALADLICHVGYHRDCGQCNPRNGRVGVDTPPPRW